MNNHFNIQHSLTMTLWFIYHLSLTIKSQNVITDTGGTTRFHLVFVPEQFLPGMSPAIIQLPMSQHPQQCALTSINITNNSNPEVV